MNIGDLVIVTRLVDYQARAYSYLQNKTIGVVTDVNSEYNFPICVKFDEYGSLGFKLEELEIVFTN